MAEQEIKLPFEWCVAMETPHGYCNDRGHLNKGLLFLNITDKMNYCDLATQELTENAARLLRMLSKTIEALCVRCQKEEAVITKLQNALHNEFFRVGNYANKQDVEFFRPE